MPTAMPCLEGVALWDGALDRVLEILAVGLVDDPRPLLELVGCEACCPKLVTTSDPKHQPATDQHGHELEHSTRRVRGGVVLINAREMVQKDVEVAVHCTRIGASSAFHVALKT